mgnify:FL=1
MAVASQGESASSSSLFNREGATAAHDIFRRVDIANANLTRRGYVKQGVNAGTLPSALAGSGPFIAPAGKKVVQKKHDKNRSHLHGVWDPADAARTIFVGNVPNSTSSKQELAKFFEKQLPGSSVESVRLRNIRLTENNSGKDRGRGVRVLRGEILHGEQYTCSAFVVFKEPADVERAVGTCSGAVFRNHHLTVTREAKEEKFFAPKTSLFLGNLSPDVADEHIWEFFMQNGITDLRRVRVVRDRVTGQGKGIAYAEFDSAGSVYKGLALRGCEIEGGRIPRICHVQKSKDASSSKPTRRAKRALLAKDGAGPEPMQAKKAKSGDKTTDRRLAMAAVVRGPSAPDDKPSWMGFVSNPRKKLDRDLRPLTMNDAERRKMLRKRAQEGGARNASGGGKKKSSAAKTEKKAKKEGAKAATKAAGKKVKKGGKQKSG